MKKVTRTTKAATAAERWRIAMRWREGDRHDAIYKKLKTLGDNPTPDAVNMIIGNISWTDCKCDECGTHVKEIMIVGDEPGYDSATAGVCKKCLTKALKELS